MKYICIASGNNRWLAGNKLNPNRIDKYYVRAKTKKRCLELLNQHNRSMSMHHINTYGYNTWGTGFEHPAGEEEGVWITRDIHDKKLIKLDTI